METKEKSHRNVLFVYISLEPTAKGKENVDTDLGIFVLK